jgi:hypothetical protein
MSPITCFTHQHNSSPPSLSFLTTTLNFTVFLLSLKSFVGRESTMHEASSYLVELYGRDLTIHASLLVTCWISVQNAIISLTVCDPLGYVQTLEVQSYGDKSKILYSSFQGGGICKSIQIQCLWPRLVF